jgi:hypothetical protein
MRIVGNNGPMSDQDRSAGREIWPIKSPQFSECAPQADPDNVRHTLILLEKPRLELHICDVTGSGAPAIAN